MANLLLIITKEHAALRTMPVVSAELFTIPLDAGRYLIYAPLRKAAFVSNATVVNALADLKEGRMDSVATLDNDLSEFLRRLGILDAGSECQPLSTFTCDPEPTTVTLFLTTACNLRCTYCYASAGETPTTFMSLDTAKRGIDFVAGNAVKKQVPHFDISYPWRGRAHSQLAGDGRLSRLCA